MSAKDNKSNDNKCIIDVITIDDEDDDLSDNDNDIEILEEKYVITSDECLTFDNKTSKSETLPKSGPTINDSNERIGKSPKRIIPTKLESIASTSVSNNSQISGINDKTDGNELTPNKVKRINGPEVDKTIEEKESEANELYLNYLTQCRRRMNAVNDTEHNETKTEEQINKLNQLVIQLRHERKSFSNSAQFAKLMKVFANDIANEKDDNRVFRHHNDLLIELNRIIKKPNTNSTKKKLSKDKINTRIKKLTERLKKLEKAISSAESEPLDYEAMDKTSSFTDLPKLYKKQIQLWEEREDLLKRSKSTGRMIYKKLKYDSTLFPEINKCVENLFNNYIKKMSNWNKKGYRDETFTFIDIHKAITQVINDNKLCVQNSNELIEGVFRDLTQEMRKRRTLEVEDVFESLETLDDLAPESFVDNDPNIELQCSLNKTYYERKMQELFQKYTIQDRQKNGEKLINEGINEWDQTLVDNEEFESIDVKDGELDDEDSDEESVSGTEDTVEEVVDLTSNADNSDNCLRDLTNS